MKYFYIVCLSTLRFANALPTEKSQQNMGPYSNVDSTADSNLFNKRDLEMDQPANYELNAASVNQNDVAEVEPSTYNEEENTQAEGYDEDQNENYEVQNAPFNFESFQGENGASINEIEWPDAWCEKECRETFLLYEGCKKQGEIVGETCVCSVHFRYKVNKCQADGCQHYYNRQPEWQNLMEKYVEECKDKGTDFVNY